MDPGGHEEEEEVEDSLWAALSRCWRSSKTQEIIFTCSSSMSLRHSWTWHALGPNRSWPTKDITIRRSLSRSGSSREGASSTVRRLNICRCVYSLVDVTPASWDISWASSTVELACCKSSSRWETSQQRREEQDTLLKKVVDSLYRCSRHHRGMRRRGSERLEPGGALVDFCIRNFFNHHGSRWFQHQWWLIMQLPTFGKCQRDLIRRWKFFGGEVLGPRIFYRKRRPGSRRTTSLGLRAVLVKAQSFVNDTFGLFDRRPLQMQLVMLLPKFWFPFKVAVKGSLGFWTRRGNIDKLLIFRGLG